MVKRPSLSLAIATLSKPYVHRFRPPTGDNYQYFLVASGHCLIVDPFDGSHVLAELASRKLVPEGVLLTHTHWDHINGVAEVLRHHNLPVYVHAAGAADLQLGQTKRLQLVSEGDRFDFVGTTIRVYLAPGHHSSHVLYLWQDYLMVGDVLFLAGCGNPNFGGNLEQLFQTIWHTCRTLPGDLYLAWGHDYAEKNLAFAATVEPQNTTITQLAAAIASTRRSGQDVAWRRLKDEVQVNPFLRCDQPAVIAWAIANGAASAAPRDVFVALRNKRNTFK